MTEIRLTLAAIISRYSILKTLLSTREFVDLIIQFIKSTTMSLKNSFKRENLFWYITVWNMFIISLPNAIQDKRIGYWITRGNLLLMACILVYVIVRHRRRNLKMRKIPIASLFICARASFICLLGKWYARQNVCFSLICFPSKTAIWTSRS